MQIKIVGEEQEEPNKIDSVEPTQISAPVGKELLERSIAQSMGIEDTSEVQRSSDKLNILLEYAKSQTKDHSPESIKWVIRDLEMKLGSPPISEKRINYVAQYAYLWLEGKKIEAEKAKFIK